MWKDYSVSYMKNNRSSSAAIIAAAIIASLFLSFLCGVFYNLWVYEIERIVMDEGDWQGRISGELDDVDLLTIKNFRNVEKVVINEELSTETNMVADVYFHNARTIYRDMPLLAEHLDLEEDAVSYHLLLLSSYLIHDPQDETPPLLLTFYLVILIFVCISLILVIHNSFAVSMNARVHQFGIFSSIGATPAQIRICLLQEAMALCLLPILLGSLLGTALAHGAIAGMNTMAENIKYGRTPYCCFPVSPGNVCSFHSFIFIDSNFLCMDTGMEIKPAYTVRIHSEYRISTTEKEKKFPYFGFAVRDGG